MTTKHTFKAGDRVVSVRDENIDISVGDEFTLTGVDGSTVLLKDRVGYPRRRPAAFYAPVENLCGTRADRVIVDELATPPAPFAVSSKPRPKAPIKPGSRHEQVLKHLTTGKSLTQGEAILLGYGTRVAATIHDLRRRGHNITTTMKEDIHGAPYAEYRLVTRGANGNRKAA